MRVLFLTNVPSPYRVEFFSELGKSVELTVLFERQSASDRDVRWKSKSYENFNAVFLKGKPIGTDASIGIDVLHYLKKALYDIIIISGYSSPASMLAIAYCVLKKIPYIISSDGAFVKKDRLYKKILKQFIIGNAKAWLCTGKISYEYLKLYGAKEENIYIYPFTSLKNEDIISEILNPKQKMVFRRKLGINEEKVVLSVGRFTCGKGYDVLLNSCKNIHQKAGVYIIGGKPTEEYLRIKESLQLTNVHFINFKSKDELREYYKAADLFVLPTRNDIWGLVINEAMSCGLPVVTTDKCIAGLELIENNINGYIVQVNNEKELTEKINKLLSDCNLCKSMAQANFEKIQDYTIEKMAKRHVEIFKQILNTTK